MFRSFEPDSRGRVATFPANPIPSRGKAGGVPERNHALTTASAESAKMGWQEIHFHHLSPVSEMSRRSRSSSAQSVVRSVVNGRQVAVQFFNEGLRIIIAFEHVGNMRPHGSIGDRLSF